MAAPYHIIRSVDEICNGRVLTAKKNVLDAADAYVHAHPPPSPFRRLDVSSVCPFFLIETRRGASEFVHHPHHHVASDACDHGRCCAPCASTSSRPRPRHDAALFANDAYASSDHHLLNTLLAAICDDDDVCVYAVAVQNVCRLIFPA